MQSLDLDRRTGWPEDLRLLLERYPRETWSGHRNLGQTARLWLQRHGLFRDLGGALQEATVQFREGLITPDLFRAWFVPRLQFFLSELHGHHQIEDLSYFPLFRAAEPRLARGFEILENDHAQIHAAIDTVATTANAFLRDLPRDGFQGSGDAYAEAGNGLLSGLIRHLDDEEDLVIPLILDRGEDDLGL